jgi:hypothetical protein
MNIETNREKQNNLFIDNILTQDDWYKNKMTYIENLSKKYINELNSYICIENVDELDNIKIGGYIKYVTFNGELKWGGKLIKKLKLGNLNYLLISNSSNNLFKICFEKNYIFYKKHTTSADKMREIFISHLDKIDNNYN